MTKQTLEWQGKLGYPIESMKVKVGLGGSHYHLLDCPAASQGAFINGKGYDYLEIEVPKVLIDKAIEIDFLGRCYRSHIDVCKALIKRIRNDN